MSEFTLSPIGYLKSDLKYRYDTPRQGCLAVNRGAVVLEAGHNYEQALHDLEGFDRIWLIYAFHLNKNWKPKIRPPRSNKKVGVFASRSPHRPSQIGMTCVELEKVCGRKVYIRNFDLLDETPILDIKPYIPYCDSFPDSATGWLPEQTQTYNIVAEARFMSQAEWIKKQTGFDLLSFARVQLEEDPANQVRKRISPTDESGVFTLAYRTWRIIFELDSQSVILKRIYSGYSSEDLASCDDTYNDKEIHKTFIEFFKEKHNEY